MKKFKEADIAISILLIVVFITFSLAKRDYTFLIRYSMVGGWQLISIVIHLYNAWFTQKRSQRYYYTWAVFIIIIIAVSGFAIYPLLLIFCFLLFASPFMALYYIWICYREIKQLNQRPLHQLK